MSKKKIGGNRNKVCCSLVHNFCVSDKFQNKNRSEKLESESPICRFPVDPPSTSCLFGPPGD